jgi:hypothetical protein
MDWLDLLFQIFEVCIIPLLGVLTAFAIKFIKAKELEVNAKHDNEVLKKYTSMLSETIVECVIATNQTYVESLKAQGAFDAEAQKVAFQKTYDSVMLVLSAEAKEYLAAAYGDLSAYIANKIESEVNLNK